MKNFSIYCDRLTNSLYHLVTLRERIDDKQSVMGRVAIVGKKSVS
ncbi:hypothetical protein [Pantanalinema sp. GBBB05]